MFDKNFYPTPKNVIEKMLENEEWYRKKILEPSAGKGDICDYFNRSADVYCIEINQDLCSILKQKRYKVVGYDFLDYKSEYIYDFIVMNPPFDEGAKHLLKAIEIGNGARVICLLNAETLKNPCNRERELLLKKLQDHNAEIIDMGSCFQQAERKTNVEVVLVKLNTVNKYDNFVFKPDFETDNKIFIEDLQHNQLAKSDVIENMVDRYNAVVNSFAQLITNINKIIYYSEGLIDDHKDKILRLIDKAQSNNNTEFFNELLESFKYYCWENILNSTNLRLYVTTKIRNDLTKFQEEQGVMSFTKRNIENLLDQLFYNRANIFEQCIVEAFDVMTKYHPENRHHVEGWKTNDAWQVNKKVILPCWVDSYDAKRPNCQISFSDIEKVRDIEKALCFIAGIKYERINSIQSVANNGLLWGQLGTSTFFDFRIYKKGTIHLTFKDDYIHSQFNIIACKGKNWLKGA